MAVIGGPGNRYTKSIPVGSRPYGVGVDPSAHTVYVTNAADDSVSVIDAATNTVTTTIPVGTDPEGAAVDPPRHTVYVADDGSNSTASVVRRDAKTLPPK